MIKFAEKMSICSFSANLLIDTSTFLTSKFRSLWICSENVGPAAKKRRQC